MPIPINSPYLGTRCRNRTYKPLLLRKGGIPVPVNRALCGRQPRTRTEKLFVLSEEGIPNSLQLSIVLEFRVRF